MSIFIDTNIFAAAKLKNDRDHKRSKQLLEDAMFGKYGKVFTSDYIFDELMTLLIMRTKNHNLVYEYGNSILLSNIIEIIKINDEIFVNAWIKFGMFKDKILSFTDCTTLAIIEDLNVNNIMSFDKHFEGTIQNISRIF
jgi:predicted nucleic acid-binding protein